MSRRTPNLFIFNISAPGSKSKVKQLQEEVKEQEDIIKHLKATNTDMNLIREAAKTLLTLKNELSIAEVEELVETSSATTTENQDCNFVDWSTIPVIHDAHELKLTEEVKKLKLKLEIEKQSNKRLRRKVKSKNLELDEKKRCSKNRRVQREQEALQMKKEYDDLYDK